MTKLLISFNVHYVHTFPLTEIISRLGYKCWSSTFYNMLPFSEQSSNGQIQGNDRQCKTVITALD